MAENSEVRDEQASNRVVSPLHFPSPSTTAADPSPIDISSFTHTPFYWYCGKSRALGEKCDGGGKKTVYTEGADGRGGEKRSQRRSPCEENAYFLCKKLSTIGLADPEGLDLFVVFISNVKKKVPLWSQKASERIDGLVIWDYHVICIQRNGETNARHLVWDLDSSLPFPFPLDQYFTEAFQPMLSLSFTYSRLFRVVHAPIFIRFFASDRSHMKDPLGNWLSSPPKYDPIVAEDGVMHNLNEYIRMSADDITIDVDTLIDGVYSNKFGVVISESMLESFIAQTRLFTRVAKQKAKASC